MKNNVCYLYCRISRNTQSLERQERNLQAVYPNGIIVKEVFTGTKSNRPEWNKLLKVIKEGDTIAFDSISRMSRDAKEGFNTYENLYNKGVNLVFLKEPHINTDTYKKALNLQIGMTGDKVDYILEGVNKYLLALAKDQIKIAFEQSEKEVKDLHQRTKEGIETARRNGKQIGQKKGNTLHIKKKKPIMDFIKAMNYNFDGKNSDIQVMELLKKTTFKVPINPDKPNGKTTTISGSVSAKTYYQYKKELKDEIYG